MAKAIATGLVTPEFCDRFWSKVQKQDDGCWIWNGAHNNYGYGRVYKDGRCLSAHRVAYEIAEGPVPPGLDLDHLCRVRDCVNPAHLEPVSRKENLLRGETIPASNSQKTHCPEGHRLSLDNLVKSAYPRRRQCRICWNKMMRDKYHAKKEVQANG